MAGAMSAAPNNVVAGTICGAANVTFAFAYVHTYIYTPKNTYLQMYVKTTHTCVGGVRGSQLFLVYAGWPYTSLAAKFTVAVAVVVVLLVSVKFIDVLIEINACGCCGFPAKRQTRTSDTPIHVLAHIYNIIHIYVYACPV